MKYSLIPPLHAHSIYIYIINGIRIATTQSHKSLAKLPLAIVNPNWATSLNSDYNVPVYDRRQVP